jgi:DegV family protein with EDD domain
MSFVLTTDSNSEIPLSWVKELDLHFLRMPYTLEGQVYDYDLGEHIDIAAFYTELRKGKMPTTMMRNVEEIRAFFESFLQAGSDVLYVAFSSALSGNYLCACQAAEGLRAAYPDRKLIFVNTLAISMAEGQLVGYAARLRTEGKTIEETAAWLEQNKLRSNAYFTVNDLFHLKRGGRVTGTTALMGTVLDIKPILRIDREGRLVQDGKVQSRRKAVSALLNMLLERGEDIENQEITVMHGDCLPDAQVLEKLIRDRCAPKSIRLQIIAPVIAAHAGPGALALIFMGKERE